MAKRYKCLKCNRFFNGWGRSDRCPECGGKLRRISDNKESQEVEGYHKEAPKDPLYRLSG
ncbi:unnamed protein product [marine sediment metagenome]|uniref:Rubredoxin-like domain-containing protein n=1 Tax=marine sediment metagenome TaxID=412755 RepID=X1QWS2_9ZZZZ